MKQNALKITFSKIALVLSFTTILISLPTYLAIKTNKASGSSDNPFAGLSDSELNKMMKQYGLDSQDFGVLSNETGPKKNTKSPNKDPKTKGDSKDLLMDLNLDDDPLKELLDDDKKMTGSKRIQRSIAELHRNNLRVLRKFNMSENDAYSLINTASKLNVFKRLPVTAMNIIKDVVNKKSYVKINNLRNSYKNGSEEMNRETEYLISNTLNSQTFMDQDNRVGRKGMLTIVEKESGKVKNLWAVLNNKVFCFYSSYNYLNIHKIFRVSQIKIIDFLYSPCFFISSNEGVKMAEINNSNDSRDSRDSSDSNRINDNFKEDNSKDSDSNKQLVCALNFREKEYWLKTLKHHQDSYKDFIDSNNSSK